MSCIKFSEYVILNTQVKIFPDLEELRRVFMIANIEAKIASPIPACNKAKV